MEKKPTSLLGKKLSATKLLVVSVGLSVAGLSYSACAQVVDDHFDDGDLGVNTFGIGTGFNSISINGNNSPPSESGSRARVAQGPNGGQRASIASKDGASLTGAGAAYSFLGLTFANNPGNDGGGDTDRFILGVKGSNVAEDPQGDPSTGFYVQFESDSIATGTGNGAWNGTSILFYESSTSVRTILGSWQFSTLNWDGNSFPNYTPTLDIQLTLGAANWAFSIIGDTQTPGVPITFGDTYANSGIVNGLTTGFAFTYMQTEAPGVIMDIDRIIITQVPEPGTIVLAGLGSLMGLMAWRRRRTA